MSKQPQQPIIAPEFDKEIGDLFKDNSVQSEYDKLHAKLENMPQGGERLTDEEAQRLAELADERISDKDLNTVGGAGGQSPNNLSPARRAALWDASALAGAGYEVNHANEELHTIHERELRFQAQRAEQKTTQIQDKEEEQEQLEHEQKKETAKARAEEAALKGRQYQIANLDIVPEQHQKTPLLPDKLMKKYVEVDGKFYYGNATEKLAFEDAGDKLKTKLDSTALAKDMVEIAAARSWSHLQVKGSESFKREVWLEAQSQGIEAKGYSPTDADKAALKKLQQDRGTHTENSIEATAIREKSPEEIAKTHPNLAPSATAIALAEKVANQLPDNQKERFVSSVREKLADNVEQNKPQPEIKVKETVQTLDEEITQER